ncbi:MAG: hypothetical protein RIB60_08075 [Phycisphaerales bacterium]
MRFSPPPPTTLRDLSHAIERVQNRFAAARPDAPDAVPTGWPGVDHALGGLRRQVVHEWLADPHPAGFNAPLALLAHLAAQAQRQTDHARLAVWIGRPCWPHPRALPAPLLERSIFVDASDRAERVWATDLCLRSPAAGVVIADARALDMSSSRRLQLAAGAGDALALLARPWRERHRISAAWTRWRAEPEPSDTPSPRWAIQLLRCKGMQPDEERTRWSVLRDDATGDVRVVPDAPDRSAPTVRPARLALA